MQTVSVTHRPSFGVSGVDNDMLRAADIAALWNNNRIAAGMGIRSEIKVRNDCDFCINETMLRDKLEDRIGLDAAGYTRLMAGVPQVEWGVAHVQVVSGMFRVSTWQGWLRIAWFAELLNGTGHVHPSLLKGQEMEQHAEHGRGLNGSTIPGTENKLETLAGLANAKPVEFGKLVISTLRAWGHKAERVGDELRKRKLEPHEMRELMPWLQNTAQPRWSARHMDAILEVLDDTPENFLKELQKGDDVPPPKAGSVAAVSPAPAVPETAEAANPASGTGALLALVGGQRKPFGAMLNLKLEKAGKRKTELHKALLNAGATGASEQNTYNLLNGSAPWSEHKIRATARFLKTTEAGLLAELEAHLANVPAVKPVTQEVAATPAAPAPVPAVMAEIVTDAAPEVPAVVEAVPDAVLEQAQAPVAEEPETAPLSAEKPEEQPEPPATVLAALVQPDPEASVRTYTFRPEEQGMAVLTAERLGAMPEPARRDLLQALVVDLQIPDELVSNFMWKLVQAHAASLEAGSTARLKVLHTALGKTLA